MADNCCTIKTLSSQIIVSGFKNSSIKNTIKLKDIHELDKKKHTLSIYNTVILAECPCSVYKQKASSIWKTCNK